MLDVVVYPLGLNAPHIFGHRGLTHSLPFAAIAAALVVRLLFRAREWHSSWPRLWLLFFAAIASHGLLDALTNGGQGVALLRAALSARAGTRRGRRFSCRRSASARFSPSYGLRVLRNEMLWLWLPSVLIAVAARLVRRRSSRTRAIAA